MKIFVKKSKFLSKKKIKNEIFKQKWKTTVKISEYFDQ